MMRSVFPFLVLLSLISHVSGGFPQHITQLSGIWRGIGSPVGVTVSKQGHVFMSDSGNSRIVEFSGVTHEIIATYELLNSTSRSMQPYDMILDESHDHDLWMLYAVCWYGEVSGIYRWNSTGHVDFMVQGRFHGITLGYDGDGNPQIYVSNHNDQYIYKYDNKGHILQTYPTMEKTPAIRPTSVAIDDWNNMYVVDATSGVIKYNAAGHVISQFSTRRNISGVWSPVHMSTPLSIAVLSHQVDSDIYITYQYDHTVGSNITQYTNRIGVYTSTGEWIRDIFVSTPESRYPTRLGGITIQNTANGISVYVVDRMNDCVIQLDLLTSITRAVYRSPFPYIGNPGGLFVSPSSPSTNSSSVYVLDSLFHTNTVFRVNAVTGFEQARHDETRYDSQWFVYSPTGLVVDSRGYIYVIYAYSRIFVREPHTGQVMTTYDASTMLMEAYAMDAQDQLYVQGDSHTSHVGILYYNDTTGIMSLVRTISISVNNSAIGSMAVDHVGPSPSIYISDTSGNRIIKYDNGGIEITRFAAKRPQSVAVDKQGNIYVASSGEHTDSSALTWVNRIIKYDPMGCPQVIYEPRNPPLGDVSLTNQYLCVDDNTGLIFYSDAGNHRIVVFPTSNYTNTCSNMVNQIQLHVDRR